MKQWMKKSLAACLALVMCLTLAACGGKEGETPAEESVNVRVAALKGPTAMGMVKLMSDYAPVEEALEDKENVVTAGGGNTYEFTLAASADEVSPKLMQGELDIACVPANLAVWDLTRQYPIDPASFQSKGRSTPFAGTTVYGENLMTICGGKAVWQK